MNSHSQLRAWIDRQDAFHMNSGIQLYHVTDEELKTINVVNEQAMI